ELKRRKKKDSLVLIKVLSYFLQSLKLSQEIISMATEDIIRRSANYNPTLWEYGFLQSLPTQYDDHWLHEEKLNKEEVKLIFHHTTDLTAKLELVDLTGKLGLAHFFEEEIKEALDFVALTVRDRSFVSRENLYLCALSFRLLRQHGYQVSQQGN
ncbi:Alpha-farnesene synthase, partial [Linum perenne]